jgi:hypothetical protein
MHPHCALLLQLVLMLLTCTSCLAVTDSPADRAIAMLQKMTLEEKIRMCHGSATKCVSERPPRGRIVTP